MSELSAHPAFDVYDDERVTDADLEPVTAPAAGGGDTRDGREWEHPNGPDCDYLCRALHPARPAAAPADDTGELREAIRNVLGFHVPHFQVQAATDAVLALPAVRDLTDGARTDRARIAAVEEIADELSSGIAGSPGPGVIAQQLRRALGGER